MTHSRPDDSLAFGASGSRDRDADDFYDFLSSSSSSDSEGEGGDEGADAARVAGDVATLASVALDHTGTRSAWRSGSNKSSQPQQPQRWKATAEELAQLAGGAVSVAGGRELRVAPDALAQHASRKSQLESALDALSLARGSGTAVTAAGEAPFRFRAQPPSQDVEMAAFGSAESASTTGGRSAETSSTTAEKVTPQSTLPDGADPLYDEGLDDADETWVRRNFRGDGKTETDATLCCPCCFMTVCMDCQRHTTYANQYRASVAINCRVRKDEILTYTSGAATTSSLPFQKRLNAAAAARTSASGESLSLLRSANEFYPVVCSDCGTTVGVLDRQQQYHFFNVLPSNC